MSIKGHDNVCGRVPKRGANPSDHVFGLNMGEEGRQHSGYRCAGTQFVVSSSIMALEGGGGGRNLSVSGETCGMTAGKRSWL